MKQNKQQIAIARVCGWTHTKTVHDPDITEYGTHPVHTADVAWDLPLPDYLNDLNAMHEAEKLLTDTQHCVFYTTLLCMFSYPQEHRFCSAAAAQRAEAFLRTLNLWTDDT